MKKLIAFVFALICLASFIGCIARQPDDSQNSSDTLQTTDTSQTNTDATEASAQVKELEKQIEKTYGIKNFKLTRLTVDTCDCLDHDSILTMLGTHEANGSAEAWGKSISISYSDFLELYRVNDNYIVYNTETTSHYDILKTDISDDTYQAVLTCLINDIKRG